MPPISFLIKPASSKCNMQCRYCFYQDESQLRAVADYGFISEKTARELIRDGIDYAEGSISFAFQGGEPTLAGLDFFKSFIDYQKEYLKKSNKKLTVVNTIQTNGTLLDDEWASFFHKEQFLVGVSLDGPMNIHDKNRVFAHEKESFTSVMRAIELLKQHDVAFNVLCVITGQSAQAIRRIYRFFEKNNLRYLQFIPCLEPLGKPRGEQAYHLSVQEFESFLNTSFELWYGEFMLGKYISVRHIDNWIGILLGQPPEACSMNGRCSIQCVVEGDGSVYPCDFYVLDQWKLGKIGENSIEDMLLHVKAREFTEESLQVPEACGKCSYYPLCRNGCKRDRILKEDALINYYCDAYKNFFENHEKEMVNVVRILKQCRRS